MNTAVKSRLHYLFIIYVPLCALCTYSYMRIKCMPPSCNLYAQKIAKTNIKCAYKMWSLMHTLHLHTKNGNCLIFYSFIDAIIISFPNQIYTEARQPRPARTAISAVRMQLFIMHFGLHHKTSGIFSFACVMYTSL